ncbi:MULTISPECIES: cytochrome P450 [Streptomyces]|uniref:Steroid C26-monooxygenase n=1 Tax=Streptomyces chartreusis NRRL 3882 TaxID=1079985 RepID=A0A2N9BKH3_STRCX|nr:MULTISPECIES: cytochrome P450 [Streptomyces]MYS91643.1 cytochrome P450 [Streptomyces sp. SID5464]SOR83866.1 Steroid C26-monooxygenase [Streptomyces chartreusis NRRL 3882]
MPMRTEIPVYHPDLYSASAIRDTYPHYAALRALGPVVWLSKHKVYALPRYAECKQVLLDDDTFVSSGGVGLNPVANRVGQGTTLFSDGDEHARRRSLLAHRLTPRALRTMQDTVDQQAAAVVEAAAARRTVDAVEVATALPMSVVPDLVGWPQQGREHLLRWAGATFDALGPFNRQAVRTLPASLGMMRYARGVVRDRSVLDGSMGHDLLRASDEGRIMPAECVTMMIDYLAPSLDTTISAISSALYLFATHPEQWRLLKADPDLVPKAVNEIVRYESPIRAFSRTAARDTELAGVPLPKGSRVLVLYGSANRDPLEWDDPDTFDIRRDAARQLGFGQGTHGCAGQGLARLETSAMLRALIERVDRIEPTGTPEWSLNNVIHRLERLPLELIPA